VCLRVGLRCGYMAVGVCVSVCVRSHPGTIWGLGMEAFSQPFRCSSPHRPRPGAVLGGLSIKVSRLLLPLDLASSLIVPLSPTFLGPQSLLPCLVFVRRGPFSSLSLTPSPSFSPVCDPHLPFLFTEDMDASSDLLLPSCVICGKLPNLSEFLVPH
jgi:hypothetical protein